MPAEPPPPPVEQVEPTELPLGLLGTISSDESESLAAVWDDEARESVVVAEGDEMADGAATVIEIDRARILLAENGATRELTFDEDETYRPPPPRPLPREKPVQKKRNPRRKRRVTRPWNRR